jgi:hypothetical protein
MRVRARTATILVAMLACAAVLGATARAEADAGATLDRTFTCAVTLRGGVYLLDARAHSGTRLQGRWAKLPYAGLRTGVFGGPGGNMLAWVTSGKPTATTMIDNEYDAFDVRTFGTIGVRRELCRETSTKVPLTSSGLQGGVAERLGNEFECFAPKQVVVRIRAVLATPGGLHRGPLYQTSHVVVREAKLVARTPAGKVLAYGDVSDSGRARLFTAKGCTAG